MRGREVRSGFDKFLANFENSWCLKFFEFTFSGWEGGWVLRWSGFWDLEGFEMECFRIFGWIGDCPKSVTSSVCAC